MWKLIESIIIEPAVKYSAFLLMFVGFLMIALGSIFGTTIDSIPFVPAGSGDILVKSGGGILGAGVFAAIMKSAQFTEYFQKNIYEVFYNPDDVDTAQSLKIKCEKLLRHLLKGTLPFSHQDASSVIMERFFDNELQFHFERFEALYDISLGDDKKTLRLTHTIKTDVVVSPGYEKVEIKQKFTTDGGVKLVSLVVDNKVLRVDNHLLPVEGEEGVYEFTLEINPECSKGSDREDRRVSIERVYECEQDIEKDPVLMSTAKRYVKGFVVQARWTNCNVYFSGTGPREAPPESTDPLGNSRWELAGRDTLLLPGEGYILVITV